MLLGSFGAALFLLTLGSLDAVTQGELSLPSLVPPFGASVVIVFFTPDAVAARPWNVLMGHLVSSCVAVTWLSLFPQAPLATLAALAVSTAGIAMVMTRSLHPPGGATALLAVLMQPKLGPWLILCPALVGALLIISTRHLLDRSLSFWWARESAALARGVSEP